jgi:hypothetical protein
MNNVLESSGSVEKVLEGSGSGSFTFLILVFSMSSPNTGAARNKPSGREELGLFLVAVKLRKGREGKGRKAGLVGITGEPLERKQRHSIPDYPGIGKKERKNFLSLVPHTQSDLRIRVGHHVLGR